jgi:hypothetical protein
MEFDKSQLNIQAINQLEGGSSFYWKSMTKILSLAEIWTQPLEYRGSQ